MPNGGSDCCGTCWFNLRNKGEAGYAHTHDPEPNHCTIRDLDIEVPFYTYCANHPHRSPEKEETPIGPVYTGDGTGRREIWVESPDSEAIRQKLLSLLHDIKEQPNTEYPIGIYRDELVIWQLGKFREKRAIPDLKRISQFDPNTASDDAFGRLRMNAVAAAKQALKEITGDDLQA